MTFESTRSSTLGAVGAYRISEVAERTGIPATTLRYHEDVGIVPAPERTAGGYRLYDDRTLARLRFISGAKQLGLSLDEVRALVKLWEVDECAPVQQEMARLVDAKIFDLARRTDELVAFANELQLIAARLRAEPHAGPCDGTCACGTIEAAAPAASPVAFVKAPMPTEAVIACTLTGDDDVAQRVDDWQRLLAQVVTREALDDGLRLEFPSGGELAAEAARLASAEVECCSWIDFTIRLGVDSTILEVRAPAAGQELLTSVFGVAS